MRRWHQKDTRGLRLSEETKEPGFVHLVDETLDASARLTLESKRLLAGKLIARRLEAKTDSAEEILLRRARSAMNDLTEEQLRLLAATTLIQNIPLDDDGPKVQRFATRDDAEAYLRKNYFGLARRLKNTAFWTADDFETLVSIGAIRIPASDSGLRVRSKANAIESWLLRNGVSP